MKLKNFKICKSIFSQTRGLMFSKPKNLVFIFDREKKVSVHSFFVFFNIDLFYLDRKKRIIEIKRNMKSFSHYSPSKSASYLVEMPSKNVNQKLTVGDQLSFYSTT